MLNIVVPMAGHGSRFAKAGYLLPKPLLPIHDVPMMQLVIDNLRPDIEHRFIFICQAGHVRDFALDEKLKAWAPGCEIFLVEEVTQGAACTVLLSRSVIDNDSPLMIANCDQYVDVDVNEYLSTSAQLDGLIMTMQADDPKWSFVSFGDDGYIDNVVEKQVISNHATVGIYNFRHGSDFVKYADRMIERDFRVNGEFYVAPVYNFMIEDGLKIGAYSIGSVEDGMYGLGIPEDLTHFASLPLSRDVTRHLRPAGRIEILSHRGYWKTSEEKNSVEAFTRSFSLGFGTETDLRDCVIDGAPTIVVSHDIPRGHEMTFSELLKIAKSHGSPKLALNIKADGLHDLLAETLKAEGYDNYFLFDSSVPDLIQGVRRKLTSYTRLSEYEPVASLYDNPDVSGVWVDNFRPGRWYDAKLIEKLLTDGKSVVLVAPDLHHRHDEYDAFLDWLVSTGLRDRDRLAICTDRPEYARDKLLNQDN